MKNLLALLDIHNAMQNGEDPLSALQQTAETYTKAKRPVVGQVPVAPKPTQNPAVWNPRVPPAQNGWHVSADTVETTDPLTGRPLQSISHWNNPVQDEPPDFGDFLGTAPNMTGKADTLVGWQGRQYISPAAQSIPMIPQQEADTRKPYKLGEITQHMSYPPNPPKPDKPEKPGEVDPQFSIEDDKGNLKSVNTATHGAYIDKLHSQLDQALKLVHDGKPEFQARVDDVQRKLNDANESLKSSEAAPYIEAWEGSGADPKKLDAIINEYTRNPGRRITTTGGDIIPQGKIGLLLKQYRSLKTYVPYSGQ